MGLNKDVSNRTSTMNPKHFHEAAIRIQVPGIADPGVYFDENTTRLMLNYRSAFIRLAMYYLNVEPDTQKGIAALERMEKLMPNEKIPMDGVDVRSLQPVFPVRQGGPIQ